MRAPLAKDSCRFDAAAHRYYIGELEVPSVTTVLEREQELDGIPRERLEAKREIGHRGHHAIALALHRVLDRSKLDPRLEGYVQAALRFKDETGCTVLRVEQQLYDATLRVAGTLDLLGVIDGATCIVDWKLGEVPSTAGLQTAAYDYLYRHSYGGRPVKRFAVQLDEEGDFKIFPYKDVRDWNWFVSALNLWWWRKLR